MEKNERNQKVYNAYLTGENAKQIGIRFGLTKHSVIKIAKGLGAPGRVYEPSEGEVGWNVCKVQDCGKIVRSRWATLCNTHYFRGRRTGTTDDRIRRGPSITSHGYMCQAMKGHPAAGHRGLLYEHRRVFYEAYGKEGHSCKWCQSSLVWGGIGAGKVHIDHLDGNKTNNDLENLAASCHRCNVNRGLFMSWVFNHRNDPVLKKIFSDSQAS